MLMKKGKKLSEKVCFTKILNTMFSISSFPQFYLFCPITMGYDILILVFFLKPNIKNAKCK